MRVPVLALYPWLLIGAAVFVLPVLLRLFAGDDPRNDDDEAAGRDRAEMRLAA